MLPNIVGKTLHDQWRAVAIWTALSGMFAAFYLSLYPSIGAVAEMQQLLDLDAAGPASDVRRRGRRHQHASWLPQRRVVHVRCSASWFSPSA